MGRSWFYLSFYHETPPEFTSEFDTVISTEDETTVQLENTSETAVNILQEDMFAVVVEKESPADVVVEIQTEVTHFV